MRWFWLDRFTEFVSGQRATSVKCVSMAEMQVDEYCPGFPHHPNSLIIEGVAQTGGLLVSELELFESRVVLAKISRAHFYRAVQPGDLLKIEVVLKNRQGAGAIVEGKTYVDGELQGELDLWFAFLDERYGSGPLFEPDDLLNWLHILRLYEVAVDADGKRLQPPPKMIEAVRHHAECKNS